MCCIKTVCTSGILETDDTDTGRPDDVILWTTEHVKLWLKEEGFEEEIPKFDGL